MSMRTGKPLNLLKPVAAGAALLAALLLPWLISDYRVFQFTQVWILAIAMLGLNLLTGWCGQVSLGHGAFFAVGAYCSALLMHHLGVPDWLTLPACALVSYAAGWLFGLPAARLEGLYLALASFALAVALPQLLKHPLLAPLTGGTQGIALDAATPPAGWPFSVEHWLYALSLGSLLVAMLITHQLVKGQPGRAMRALRDHAVAASTLSISLLVGIVIGGLASIPGSVLGALFVQFVPYTAEQVSREAAWAIYGLFLLIALWAMPGGIAGLGRGRARQR